MKIGKPLITVFLIINTILFSANANADNPLPTSEEAIKTYIAETASQYHIPEKELNFYLNKARISEAVIEKMNRPLEAKPWDYYKSRSVTPEKIQAGVKFWHKHRKDLARAEQEYGVPASIIVAILGIETLYGKHKGDFRVLDSLSTLAFAYPPRSHYFKKELTQFFLLSREQGLNPTHVYGSYAGAIGYPQFMPSSYRQYAVNFAGRETADLEKNPTDAIGSIANYLKMKGWRAGEPVASLPEITGDQYLVLIKEIPPKNYRPRFTLQQLREAGIKFNAEENSPDKATLIGLETTQGREWWVGYPNFSVITSYNTSANYAMAVYELSQEVQKAYQTSAHAHHHWFKKLFGFFN